MTDFSIRLVNPEDIPFIYSTWLKSFKQDSSTGTSMRKTVFMKDYVKVIDAILQDPNTTVFVACKLDEPNIILGYMVFGPNRVFHYIFVKEAFRLFGIARTLFKSNQVDGESFCTHQTRTAAQIIRNYNITHNQLLLFKGV